MPQALLLSAPPVRVHNQRAGSCFTAVQGQVQDLHNQLQRARQEQGSWQQQLGEAEQRAGQLQEQVKQLQERLQEAREEAAESKSQAGRLQDQVGCCAIVLSWVWLGWDPETLVACIFKSSSVALGQARWDSQM